MNMGAKIQKKTPANQFYKIEKKWFSQPSTVISWIEGCFNSYKYITEVHL